MSHCDSQQPSLPPAISTPRRWQRPAIAAVLVIGAAAYVGSGFYFVEPNERAVVRWFGRVPESQRQPPFGVEPGLHYALPWPLCKVDRPKTTDVRRVLVGTSPEQRQAVADREVWAMQASPATDMLTGDVNILKVTMAVQYRVDNAVEYLFATGSPDDLVRLAVQAVLIEALARIPVDQALTTAKAQLENDVRVRSQQLLDRRYGCGIRLDWANVESIEPPNAIISAFQDVVGAKKYGEQKVEEAVTEENQILPRARGDAARMIEEARAYAQGRISRAEGEVARFLDMLVEYQRAPRVTAERLRLQTFERILAKVRKVIVDNKPGEKPTQLRIIDQRPR